MRNSPVAGAPPIEPSTRPSPQAPSPLASERPARTPTIESPKIESMKSSADVKTRINGRAISTKPVSTSAPTSPPKSEEAKAAESASAARPSRDIGKPSSTVAWLAEEPGIPIKTDAKVSEVGITATRPISIASAEVASMP